MNRITLEDIINLKTFLGEEGFSCLFDEKNRGDVRTFVNQMKEKNIVKAESEANVTNPNNDKSSEDSDRLLLTLDTHTYELSRIEASDKEEITVADIKERILQSGYVAGIADANIFNKNWEDIRKTEFNRTDTRFMFIDGKNNLNIYLFSYKGDIKGPSLYRHFRNLEIIDDIYSNSYYIVKLIS